MFDLISSVRIESRPRYRKARCTPSLREVNSQRRWKVTQQQGTAYDSIASIPARHSHSYATSWNTVGIDWHSGAAVARWAELCPIELSSSWLDQDIVGQLPHGASHIPL